MNNEVNVAACFVGEVYEVFVFLPDESRFEAWYSVAFGVGDF